MIHEAAIVRQPGWDRLDTIPNDDDQARPATWLLCRAGTQLCALPTEHVIEVMRHLPITPIAGAPIYVRGMSVIRGAPVVVVDAALLVGQHTTEIARLVTIRAGTRTFALAVQSVLDISTFASDKSGQLPPLLRDTANETIEAIGILDAELLFFLRTARIVSEEVLAALTAAGAAS